MDRYNEVTGRNLVSSDKELLKSLDCIKEVDGEDKITNAGILLFGKNPCKFFPRHYVTIVRYPGKDIGSAYLEIRDIEGNLFNQIDGAEGYINKHIESLYRLKEGQAARERIQQYPAFVIRELIANAVAHRDYSISGSRIIIKMFKDSIEFDSPGGFAGDVNEKNILEKQFSRNPIIVKVLNKARYVEELGEGWNRIIDEIKSHPLKPKLPKIKGNGNVKVRLFSPGMEIETKIEPIISQLNERQKKSLQFLKEHNRITTKDYIAINNVSERTARYDLADMVNKEVLQKIGKTQAAYYIIRQTFGKKGDKKMKVCRKTSGCLEMFQLWRQLCWLQENIGRIIGSYQPNFGKGSCGKTAGFFIESNSRILDLFFWLFWGLETGNERFWMNGVENGV